MICVTEKIVRIEFLHFDKNGNLILRIEFSWTKIEIWKLNIQQLEVKILVSHQNRKSALDRFLINSRHLITILAVFHPGVMDTLFWWQGISHEFLTLGNVIYLRQSTLSADLNNQRLQFVNYHRCYLKCNNRGSTKSTISVQETQ